jgi:hypothetical protein
MSNDQTYIEVGDPTEKSSPISAKSVAVPGLDSRDDIAIDEPLPEELQSKPNTCAVRRPLFGR